jgi:hypothetical protein
MSRPPSPFGSGTRSPFGRPTLRPMTRTRGLPTSVRQCACRRRILTHPVLPVRVSPPLRAALRPPPTFRSARASRNTADPLTTRPVADSHRFPPQALQSPSKGSTRSRPSVRSGTLRYRRPPPPLRLAAPSQARSGHIGFPLVPPTLPPLRVSRRVILQPPCGDTGMLPGSALWSTETDGSHHPPTFIQRQSAGALASAGHLRIQLTVSNPLAVIPDSPPA